MYQILYEENVYYLVLLTFRHRITAPELVALDLWSLATNGTQEGQKRARRCKPKQSTNHYSFF